MPYFTSGDYVYFKDNEQVPKSHHKVFVFNHESDFYITSPLKLLGGRLLSFPKLFLNNIIELWNNHNIQVVS